MKHKYFHLILVTCYLFLVSLKISVATTCDEKYVLLAQNIGYISSPNYPFDAARSVGCNYTFYTKSAIRVCFVFEEFDLDVLAYRNRLVFTNTHGLFESTNVVYSERGSRVSPLDSEIIIGSTYTERYPANLLVEPVCFDMQFLTKITLQLRSSGFTSRRRFFAKYVATDETDLPPLPECNSTCQYGVLMDGHGLSNCTCRAPNMKPCRYGGCRNGSCVPQRMLCDLHQDCGRDFSDRLSYDESYDHARCENTPTCDFDRPRKTCGNNLLGYTKLLNVRHDHTQTIYKGSYLSLSLAEPDTSSRIEHFSTMRAADLTLRNKACVRFWWRAESVSETSVYQFLLVVRHGSSHYAQYSPISAIPLNSQLWQLYEASVNISSGEEITLHTRVTSRKAHPNNVLVDDFSVTPGNCKRRHITGCSFEDNLCGWRLLPSSTKGWKHLNARLVKSLDMDHTSAVLATNFFGVTQTAMVIGLRREVYDSFFTSRIRSPTIHYNIEKTRCFSFWIRVSGMSIGQRLSVSTAAADIVGSGTKQISVKYKTLILSMFETKRWHFLQFTIQHRSRKHTMPFYIELLFYTIRRDSIEVFIDDVMLVEDICGNWSSHNGCTRSQFPCVSGECIADWRRCNRVVDCADGSDELSCPRYRTNSTRGGTSRSTTFILFGCVVGAAVLAVLGALLSYCRPRCAKWGRRRRQRRATGSTGRSCPPCSSDDLPPSYHQTVAVSRLAASTQQHNRAFVVDVDVGDNQEELPTYEMAIASVTSQQSLQSPVSPSSPPSPVVPRRVAQPSMAELPVAQPSVDQPPAPQPLESA